MARPTKSSIIQELRELGLENGDVVFVAADLMRVGYFNKTQDQTLRDWVEIFDEVLGREGTIVVPTYSPSVLRFIQKSDFVFTPASESTSGSLARAYLHHAPDVEGFKQARGKHPTNSCVSRGAKADIIAASDAPQLPKYQPYAKVVEMGGKNLMLGIVDERNSPFTYHHVQENMGHTRKHPLSGLFKTRYLDDDGKEKTFVLREMGGCTGGVHKAWGYHLAANAVKFARVGRSTSALLDAKKSTEILTRVITQNPHLMRCDNPACVSCYGRFRYNGTGAIFFYFRQAPKLAMKLIKRLRP